MLGTLLLMLAPGRGAVGQTAGQLTGQAAGPALGPAAELPEAPVPQRMGQDAGAATPETVSAPGQLWAVPEGGEAARAGAVAWAQWGRRATATAAPPAEPDRGLGYQWRGFVWQNIEFNVVENGFRVSADHVMRDTLGHKPFWHDYIASLHQFNMRRWNDGDTFIVNYVGHSLHGAVASYLEIQNSPEQARLRWGDKGYAASRFKGFLWATAFSTHSEISPAGEAGVGNEGGFTYGVECQYHCTAANFHAGDHYTNNTGWVDFIVTPTAGTLWVVTEDILDRYVSDYLQARNPGRFWPKVVRGGLNPGRSFANWLQWKPAWYRANQEPMPTAARVHWFPEREDAAWTRAPRFEVSPYYSRFSIAANTPTCFNCRVTVGGPAMEASERIRDWLSFDTAVSYQARASLLPSDRAGGNMTFAAFGLRASKHWRYYAVHFAVRPGLVHFTRAYLVSPAPVVITTYPPGIATHGGDADTVPGPGVVDANGTASEPALGDITHFVWDFA